MCNPGPIMAGMHLQYLVQPHLVERLRVVHGLALDRALCRHTAHGMNAAAMTGPNQQVDVRFQEVTIHRDACAVGQDELGAAAEFLDEAENVVPPAAVETRRMIPQLVEDLVHLK